MPPRLESPRPQPQPPGMQDPGNVEAQSHTLSHTSDHGHQGLGSGPNITQQSRQATVHLSIYCDAALSLSLGALLALSLYSTALSTRSLHRKEVRARLLPLYFAQCLAIGYAFLLTCLPARWRRPLSTQSAVILLSVWLVYAYRDIWPLATFSLTPLDAHEGPVLWVKVSLLTAAAIVIPLIAPRHPTPSRGSSDTIQAPSPEQTASILSSLTYTWLDPLIWKAQTVNTLPVGDTPPLAEYNKIEHLVNISSHHVDPTKVDYNSKHKFTIALGLARLFRPDLAIMASMVVLASAASFLPPLGLKHILSYIEGGGANEFIRPWFWLVALLSGSMAVSMAMQYYHYVSTQVVARTQSIVTQLIFDHSLRMRSKVDTSKYNVPSASGDADQRAAGKAPATQKSAMPSITNLVTTDLTNVTNASTFVLLMLLETPIQLVLSLYFLYSILGWSTFTGVVVMMALSPLPTMLSGRTRNVQKVKAKQACTDKRVTLVKQMLDAMRTIKLLGWEKEQAQLVDGARDDELKSLRKASLLQIWIGCLNVCIPLLIMISSYATFTVVMKRELSASIVFSSISLFEILRTQYNMVFFRIPILTQGQVSLERIHDFLQRTELLDKYTRDPNGALPQERTVQPSASEDVHISVSEGVRPPASGAIVIRNMHFTWTSERIEDSSGFSLKIEGELFFKKNAINLVMGPTACGKTSLLMALLGEMHCHYRGTESSVSFPPDAGIAYAAQESWVLADTVRNNVLFGSTFEENRYRDVLDACALDLDCDEWEDRDLTRVGEGGVTLSGGQKARLTLARAAYSRAEMVLLDDVFSALDNTTVRHIVKHLFAGNLFHNRTVIIVSNNVRAIMPAASWVVKLGPNGNFLRAGPPQPRRQGSIDEVFESFEEPSAANVAAYGPNTQVKEEEKAEGHVGWDPMKLLFDNMAPRIRIPMSTNDTSLHPALYWLVLFVSLLLFSLVTNAQIWLLGVWAEQYSERPASEVSVALYLSIYIALVLGAMLTNVGAQYMHLIGCLEASAVIHKKLIASVLGTTFSWFNATPKSRIVARCTDDIGNIDGQIASLFFKLLDLTVSMLFRLFVVMFLAPVFMIAVAVVAVLSGLCARLYMKAQLPVKREQSNTRAPLLGHLNNTLVALVSIRAYQAEEAFKQNMHLYIDNWTRVTNTFYNLNRWLIVRADLIGTVFTVSLAAYLTYSTRLNASTIGISLNMAIAFSSKVFDWVRTLNTFEVAGNSLERIDQYLHIEQESTVPDVVDLVDGWPKDGELEVQNLKAYYDDTEVLKGINFTVRAGERIGIVGRTGSGKSTLLLALLRCIRTNGEASTTKTTMLSSGDGPNDGPASHEVASVNKRAFTEDTAAVVYSGQSIFSLNLATLRKNITIIPQTPELFLGTIRQNIDPFSEYTEAELERALLSAQGLDDEPNEEYEDRLTLDREISPGGENLSAGQRQIIALARAIVRKSKLLIMDEATSSIDFESDILIQRSLRKSLDEDVTVLTVAHRLSTIHDYNKVLVLDDGHSVEFDTPQKLLQNPNGAFSKLYMAAPFGDREILRAAFNLPNTAGSRRSSLDSSATLVQSQ